MDSLELKKLFATLLHLRIQLCPAVSSPLVFTVTMDLGLMSC